MSTTQDNPTPDGIIEIKETGDYPSARQSAALHLQHIYGQALALYGSDLSTAERAIACLAVVHDSETLEDLGKIEYFFEESKIQRLFVVKYYHAGEELPVKVSTYSIHATPVPDLSELPADTDDVAFKPAEESLGFRYIYLSRKEYLASPNMAQCKVVDHVFTATPSGRLQSGQIAALSDVNNFTAVAFAIGCAAVQISQRLVNLTETSSKIQVSFMVQSFADRRVLEILRTGNYYFSNTD